MWPYRHLSRVPAVTPLGTISECCDLAGRPPGPDASSALDTALAVNGLAGAQSVACSTAAGDPVSVPRRPAFPLGAKDALSASERPGPKRKLYSAVPGRLFVAVKPYQPQVDGEIPLHRGDRVKGQCPGVLGSWGKVRPGPLWKIGSPGRQMGTE